MASTYSGKLPWTGERLVPEVHNHNKLEHLHRYALAKELAKGKQVLDIACGEGYGANLLAAVAESVVGVDIDKATISHAQKRYGAENLSFIEGACHSIPLPDSSVDLVVSFETLEHHDKHQEFMAEVKRVMRPGGILIISSPDKANYNNIIMRGIPNPFHEKELSAAEFHGLISQHFAFSKSYHQKTILASMIIPVHDSPQRFHEYQGDYHNITRQQHMVNPIYHITLASDKPLGGTEFSIFHSGVLEQTGGEESAPSNETFWQKVRRFFS